MESFGVRLRAALDRRGPLCVGIDPHAALLRRWGLPDSVEGVDEFVRTVIDALADRVAIFKPQSAFFERFGSRGIAVLESAIARLRSHQALVLLDVKRGDMPSTVAAYAEAYLHPDSPLRVDAITASPYLGVGSLQPMFEAAAAHGGGVFVLARTSNPEGATIQGAVTSAATPVAQHVVDEISQLNRGETGPGADRWGSFGVVVGATVGAAGLDLSGLGGPVLAPGLGAQGAVAEDLVAGFGAARTAVLPSYSREVLAAGPDQAALRAAAGRALSACRQALLTPA